MKPPLAVVIGFVGKLPVAGMGLFNLHYILGLQQLGYEVHYVERQNYESDCYNPDANTMTSDPSYALAYLRNLMPTYAIGPERMSFLDLKRKCHFADWPELRRTLDRADFVLTLCEPVWFDELQRCPQRAFLDGDPMFTQVEFQRSDSLMSKALENYHTLFTYGVRMGQPDCTVPSVSREWLPSRPVVATALWDSQPCPATAPITTVMNWAGAADVKHKGHAYGHKNRELQRFIDLPKQTSHQLVLAIGGNAPKADLMRHGWRLENPLECTRTVDAYRRFISRSRADLGIAKHAYVASRSGWFSDRSTCYLAAGRPVLHQDTGCGDWLPTGEGVLLFSDMDELLDALVQLESDYERHCSAARRLAEEEFEAAKIVGQMLDAAGLR